MHFILLHFLHAGIILYFSYFPPFDSGTTWSCVISCLLPQYAHSFEKYFKQSSQSLRLKFPVFLFLRRCSAILWHFLYISLVCLYFLFISLSHSLQQRLYPPSGLFLNPSRAFSSPHFEQTSVLYITSYLLSISLFLLYAVFFLSFISCIYFSLYCLLFLFAHSLQ